MNIYFDTNIILDIFEKRPQSSAIQKLIQKIDSDNVSTSFVSAISVSNLYYILNKNYAKSDIDRLVESFVILPVLERMLNLQLKMLKLLMMLRI